MDPRQLRFVAAKNGNILQTAGSNLASDVCLGGSETTNIGEALMLWAKPQPNDAIAVLLVNNHPHRSFQNVTFTLIEVGFTIQIEEVVVRDLWSWTNVRESVDGVVALNISSRDAHMLLLTPKVK